MRKITFLLLVLVFFSCLEEKKEAALESATVIAAVKEVFNDYVDHVNTEGFNGVEFYFSKDDRFYWIEDGVVQYQSRKEMLDAIAAFSPTVKTVRLKAPRSDVEVLDSNTVMLYVEYVEDILLHSGYEFTLDGAMTILTINEDTTWKFLIGHSSLKKPRGEY